MIDDRLANWKRAYKSRMIMHTCGSVEKYYHAPWRQWVALTDIQISQPIDYVDAAVVETAWKKLLGRYRLILKYAYMHDFPDYVVAKKTGVKIYLLEQELRRAKSTLEKVLTPIGDYGNITTNLRKTRFCDDASELEASAPLKESLAA